MTNTETRMTKETPMSKRGDFSFVLPTTQKAQSVNSKGIPSASPGLSRTPAGLPWEYGVTFADGHAESHPWRDPGVIKALRDNSAGRFNGNWPGGNAMNPDFRWVYQRYKHRKWAPLQ